MSTRVSNRVFITAVNDGASLSAVLRSDDALTQVYSPVSGACIPDWNDPANQPTVFAVLRVKGVYKSSSWLNVKWSYNGEEIIFDSSTNLSTNFMDGSNPIFQRTSYEIVEKGNRYIMPALKILRNLANVGNQDQDVIQLEGGLEIGGSRIPYSCNIAVRISQQSSSGYFGFVEGNSFISTAGGTAKMDAYLYNGTDPVRRFTTKWYREGIDETPWKTVVATESVAEVTITEQEVTDYVVIRVDFYNEDNEKIFTAFWDIDDLQDMEEMFVSYEDANPSALREDELLTLKVWMGRRTDQYEVDDRYTKFTIKMLNSSNETVPCLLRGGTPGQVIDVPGEGEQGEENVDITQSNVIIKGGSDPIRAGVAGVVRVPYSFAVELGETISGILVASDQ